LQFPSLFRLKNACLRSKPARYNSHLISPFRMGAYYRMPAADPGGVLFLLPVPVPVPMASPFGGVRSLSSSPDDELDWFSSCIISSSAS
jgi:hypothetical protein